MANKQDVAEAMQRWKAAFDAQYAFWNKADVLEFEGKDFEKWMALRDLEDAAREDLDTALDEFLS